uniref:Ankyrin repeat protein RF-0381 n=1 Tax=Cajanus cajan TaxID=3821 RepID=A0A151U0C1_CAJCA|nr:Putative ankyrin repeat protein RF-0381 [Cajanus cajan]
MDRLIKVDPTNTVPIRIEAGQKCQGKITLRNVMYTMPVAFRLQPLIKTRYTVKPHSGIISPLATISIEIVYSLPGGSTLPHSFPHSEDSFLLHSVVVPGATVKEPSSMFESVPSEWFTAKKKQVFIDSGIRILFVGSLVLAQLVQDGSMDEIREVLEHSDPTWKAVDSVDPNGDTLLHVAISRSRPDLVQLLLEFNADVEAANRSGLTHKATTERKESSAFGAIHLAAREGHVEVLRLVLLKGADVDSLSRDGTTALHVAVKRGERECVRLLLANNARLDIRDSRDGDTCVHVAAGMGDESMVKLLLKKGANKDVRNYLGKTAYDVAVENGATRVLDALRLGDGLCVAARKGEVRSMERVIESGAAVNGRDQHGWTALHRACFKGRVEAVRALLEKGIELEARDEEGYSALHCAVEAGHADVAEVLVKRGVDVEARTSKGVTALQIAEALGYVGFARVLGVRHVAEPHWRNKVGRRRQIPGSFHPSMPLPLLL